MREPWITANGALQERLVRKGQVDPTEPEAAMPPYLESFLAHLRLLVGVPFDYLVPDARLLPPESIRFFYLDRSWTDRLVDGAAAVGKTGTREQAHYQAQAPGVQQQLDVSERMVRSLQRREGSFPDLKTGNDAKSGYAAAVVTGFLLRSAAVSGWPHMDVRAYNRDLPEPLDPGAHPPAPPPAGADTAPRQLRTLRLEVLSPSVLLALFEGVPQLVTVEEPHHGVQFAVQPAAAGLQIFLRDGSGQQILQPPNPPPTPFVLPVPTRTADPSVIAVADLRDRLQAARNSAQTAGVPAQTGSAALAIELLNPPWRQRFEGTADHAGENPQPSSAGSRPPFRVAGRVQNPALAASLGQLLTQTHGKPS